MKKYKDENINKILTQLGSLGKHIDKAAGDYIRKQPKNVQEDALNEAVLAHLEGRDIVKHLVLWRRKQRNYEKKILSFTRARPLKRDKEELIRISKAYK